MSERNLPEGYEFVRPMLPIFDGSSGRFWVAGGCFASLILGQRVRDYDIFCPDPNATILDLESRGFKRSGPESDFVANLFGHGIKAQVVLKYTFQSPEETIAAFDFTVACAAFDGERFIHHERFYRDLAHRKLVVNSLPKPLSTLSRALRYSRKGYTLCPVGLATILRAIQDLNVNWESPSENDIEFYPDGTPKFRGLD